MKLAQVIAIHAGGPGSGCHGSNCGRPITSAKRAETPSVGKGRDFYVKGHRVAYSEKKTQAGHGYGSARSTSTTKYSDGSKDSKTYLKFDKQGLKKLYPEHADKVDSHFQTIGWFSNPDESHVDSELTKFENKFGASIRAGGTGSGPNAPCPQCGPKGEHGQHPSREYREGDKVKLLKSVRAWDEKTWNRKTFQPGEVARVLKVIPALGHNPEKLLIKIGKHGSEEYVESQHVTFHHIAGQPLDPKGGFIKSKPLAKEWTKQKFNTPHGYRYGIARETKMRKPRSSPARGWVGDRMANNAS